MLRGNVTTKAKQIKNLKCEIENNRIPDILDIDKYDIQNQFPFNDILPNHKCILGTFADYLIRKMIHDIRGDPIHERLICEVSMNCNHNNAPWRKKKNVNPEEFWELINTNCNPSFPKDEEETFLTTYTDIDVINQYKQYIDNYKNRPWNEIINDIWELSLLDALYRSGTYSHIPCYLELLDVEHPFYQSLFNTANKFSDTSKEIFYNPTLGRRKGNILTKGDADLIYGDELIDWKCTKKRNYSNDLIQCLIYTGLARDDCNGHTINKCSVYYLTYGTYTSIDVKDWNEKEFMDKYSL